MQYLLRAQEVLKLKSEQLELNAQFIPVEIHKVVSTRHNKLYQQVSDILAREEIVALLEPQQKTWYREQERQAEALVCLQVDAYGLAREGHAEKAKENIVKLHERMSADRAYPGATKTSSALATDYEAAFLPNSFAPMYNLLQRGAELKSKEINDLVKTLNLPTPR